MKTSARALLVASGLVLASAALSDVEHIVVWMQENRAYDHYYGVLRGVRGFQDRTALLLPDGRPAFYQPLSKTNASSYQLPWHVDTTTTSGTCMNAPAMDYITDLGMWNEGRMDAWCTARAPGMGMGHFERTDLPYYYALADGFTIADQYHQSTFTQTTPNRLHLFSGCNGLAAGFAPILDNSESYPYTWPTLAETLQEAGVTWRVLMESDYFDDNGFLWFKTFHDAQPGSVYYDNGKAFVPDLVKAFGELMDNNTLPQVTIIVGPADLSEHATYHPAAGEDLSARLIAQLKAHPDVYAKTVFILNYDEGGQFFDHMVVPTPPLSESDGISTVNVTQEVYAGLPMGMGFRVPAFFISPWSRGGYVNSEVFDHTSVIQFIEKRFNVHHPAISDWRRAVAGDIISAFNFDAPPDLTWPTLPDTSAYPAESNTECKTLPPPKAPAVQAMPTQEPGTRPARPLPYTFLVSDKPAPTGVTLTLTNAGTAGVVLSLFDLVNTKTAPFKYTVEGGKSIVNTRLVTGAYGYVLQGPNGFARKFTGSTTEASSASGCVPTAALTYDEVGVAVVASLTNAAAAGSDACVFSMVDNAYGGSGGPWKVTVAPGATQTQSVSVAASAQWYDLTVNVTSSAVWSRRFMGHMENGRVTTSDPAVGTPLHPWVEPAQHPLVPDEHINYKIEMVVGAAAHKDAVVFANYALLE